MLPSVLPSANLLVRNSNAKKESFQYVNCDNIRVFKNLRDPEIKSNDGAKGIIMVMYETILNPMPFSFLKSVPPGNCDHGF